MKSSLYIKTAARLGITYLKESYCTQPFKLANVTEDRHQPLLQLMVMSSSPGILNDDVYEIKIDVSADTHLLLLTQSYQRLFSMAAGASQLMEIKLDKGSSFCFIPHPTVPHENAVFSTRNNLYLTDDCNLVWGEVFACGRLGIGESFLFSKFHSLTKIYKNNKLILHENVLMQPANIDLQTMGQFEGYTHQATLIYLDEYCVVNELIEAISAKLSKQTDFEFGITMAPVNGFVLRILGSKAELLYDALHAVYRVFLMPQNDRKYAS
jgi:urease accessory protein